MQNRGAEKGDPALRFRSMKVWRPKSRKFNRSGHANLLC
jgi:hypothetical protein